VDNQVPKAEPDLLEQLDLSVNPETVALPEHPELKAVLAILDHLERLAHQVLKEARVTRAFKDPLVQLEIKDKLDRKDKLVAEASQVTLVPQERLEILAHREHLGAMVQLDQQAQQGLPDL
jgi:hypothetical protein